MCVNDIGVCACARRSLRDGCREGEADAEPRRSRLMTLDAREGRSGSPRIGADSGIGDPGTPTAVLVGCAAGAEGALYRYVEARTIDEPLTKASVMG